MLETYWRHVEEEEGERRWLDGRTDGWMDEEMEGWKNDEWVELTMDVWMGR